jgi:hypothetical protein
MGTAQRLLSDHREVEDEAFEVTVPRPEHEAGWVEVEIFP